MVASGLSPSNFGSVLPFIAPFDLIDIDDRSRPPRYLSARRWRQLMRDAATRSAPPGCLRTLVGARVDVMAYQLEPALALLSGRGTRVLLADDVGLGKTIQAGLILAELRAAGAADRALIVVPASIRDQWKEELADRFGIDGTVADTAMLRQTVAAFPAGLNPWLTLDTAIASIDLVKRPEHLTPLLGAGWDLLIVDEAHAVASENDRRRAASVLAERTPYVVLVTATPHNGSRPDFVALCGIGAHGDRPLMFRRTRDQLRLGSPGRRLHRLVVAPTPAEQRMHASLAALTTAVRREHGESSRDVWLALAVLNKRALSSAWAFAQTIRRRLASLEPDLIDESQLPLFPPDVDLLDDAPIEWPAGAALADGARERRLLAAVETAARHAILAGESKIRVLRRLFRRTDESAIVFTEYRDTLLHLASCLARPTLKLHGLMSARERREAIDTFTRDGGILLATDAAAEGLNLHRTCRLIVHLELPWNPTRLQQRVGRVDRIGQRRIVHSIALIAGQTSEGRVLQRLRERIAQARRDAWTVDPIDGDRDIERVVLSGETSPIAAAASGSEPLFDLIDMTEGSTREQERVNLLRAIHTTAAPSALSDDGGWGRARRPVVRTAIANRVLFLIELALVDGCGRTVYRDVLSLLAPDPEEATSRHETLKRMVADFERLKTDVTGAWNAAALSAFTPFGTMRAARSRAIVQALGTSRDLYQIGLFDRRAERTRTSEDAAALEERHSITRRLSLAEEALTDPSTDCRLRLVLFPR